MELFFKLMDDFRKISLHVHTAALRHQFRREPQVYSIGYVPNKHDWVDRTFPTFNFSFILKGQGEYMYANGSCPVVAPCVITQWPGVPVRYGPKGEWEELFLIYGAGAVSSFCDSGLVYPQRPVWRVSNARRLRELIGDLFALLERVHKEGRPADSVDLLCEQLILESLLEQEVAPQGQPARAIQKIRNYVEKNYLIDHDFDELASETGLTPGTFRRHWGELVGTPPHRYLVQLRLQQACRLLAESNLSIGEIAAEVSFNDPLYFSRKFRQHTGMTASDYRRHYQRPVVQMKN
jgi:AraC-like DNA-binding protein